MESLWTKRGLLWLAPEFIGGSFHRCTVPCLVLSFPLSVALTLVITRCLSSLSCKLALYECWCNVNVSYCTVLRSVDDIQTMGIIQVVIPPLQRVGVILR